MHLLFFKGWVIKGDEMYPECTEFNRVRRGLFNLGNLNTEPIEGGGRRGDLSNPIYKAVSDMKDINDKAHTWHLREHHNIGRTLNTKN